MEALKIIICLLVGFIIGLFFIPATIWIKDKMDKRVKVINFAETIPKNISIPLVKQGNISAYDDLFRYFCYSGNLEELLPYALLMANKYNYERAYFDVCYCLWALYPETTYRLSLLDSLDETTRNLALEYLQKGAELGETNCLWRLGNYYLEGKYFEQDTILGKN